VGAADVLFELWHKGRKLSDDNPMPVDWYDVSGPPLGVTRRYNDTLELPAMSKSRMVGSTANLYNVSPVSQAKVSPVSHNRVSPVALPAAAGAGAVYEIGQNNLGHPVARAQELPPNQTPAPRYEMPAVASPTNGAPAYWPQQMSYPQGPVQFQQMPVQYQMPAGYQQGPVPYQQGQVPYQQMPVAYQQMPQSPVQLHELPSVTDVSRNASTVQRKAVAGPSSPRLEPAVEAA
jgi:hypothetical protein